MTYLKYLLRCSAAPSAAFVLSNVLNDKRQCHRHRHGHLHVSPKSVSCEAEATIKLNVKVKVDDSAIKIVAPQKVDPLNVQPPPPPTPPLSPSPTPIETTKETEPPVNEEEVLFHGIFPLRQLWKPQVPYPLWDANWDGRKLESTGDKQKDHQTNRFIRKNGVTRHIILIRHGQYDETHREDEKRILTPLGRKQAELTGKRLAEMIAGIDAQFGPCHVKTIRVSNLARAKETADIIQLELADSVERAEPDPMLNEGRPCHTIPGGGVSRSTIEKTDEGHARIEQAFQTYFYRAETPEVVANDEEEKSTDVEVINEEEASKEGQDELKVHPQHEFEIIVCHANGKFVRI